MCLCWIDRVGDTKKNSCFRKFKNNPTNDNLIDYRRHKAKMRFVIKQAKKRSKEKIISLINCNTSITQVWRKAKFLKNSRKNYHTKIGLLVANTIVQDPQKISNVFVESFAQISDSSTFSADFLINKKNLEKKELNFQSSIYSSFNNLFSMEELNQALSQIKKTTAAGKDNIIYPFIIHLNNKNKLKLLDYFNFIWKYGLFPSDWRLSLLIPIYKSGKIITDPTSYRPIALTSCLCKIMERMVLKRLMSFLNGHNIIKDFQSGFRKKYSTMDSLIRLEGDIRETFIHGEYLNALFLDIEKAYDRTWTYGVLIKLHNMGLRGTLPIFLQNFMLHRRIQVLVEDKYSEVFEIDNGIPQGSVLSPILFSLMINDIFEDIPLGINYSIYADDVALWCKHESQEQSHNLLQNGLHNVLQWSNKWGFSLSSHKTVAMIFSNKKINNSFFFKIDNTKIAFKPSYKFLGMILDNKLTWKYHIKDLKYRCEKIIPILKYLGGKKNGCDRKLLLYLYTTLIRSKIDYGCFLYDTCSQELSKSVSRIQYQCIRIAIGALKNTPVDHLETEAFIMPLHIRRKKLSLQYIVQRLSYLDHPIRKIFNDFYLFDFYRNSFFPLPCIGRLKMIFNRYHLPIQSLSTTFIFKQKSVPVDLDFDMEKWSRRNTTSIIFNSIISEKLLTYRDDHFHIVFTDGSRTTDHVGSAFSYDGIIYQYSLPSYSSIFTAEAFSIYKALQLFLNKPHYKIVIFSDSRSVLTAMKSDTPNHFLISKIQNILLLMHRRMIKFIWIPSHVGNCFHDAVDQAAKYSYIQGIPIDLSYSLNEFQGLINKSCLEMWQEEWNKCRGSLPKIKPLIQDWEVSYDHNRSEQVALARIRLDTTLINSQHYFSNSPYPKCSICNSRLTLFHIFMDCPKFVFYRNILRNKCKEINIPFDPINIFSISFPSNMIIDFLKYYKLFTYI